MSAIRSKHTLPEVLLRKALRKKKIAYKLHYGKEKIDIAITSKKLAVFVDGCFWHGCPKHGRKPKSNKAYWLPKLRKNIARDKAKAARLRAAGWKVVRFWEHDVLGELKMCAKKVSRLAK
ncbi:DNA mismatch endonuclease Vsr [uncultured archaeon]|nr:DNA mismatch endonuclease Vsr [uncultured archaeon]